MSDYEKAIKSPVAKGGVGWYSIDQREVDAVTALLKNPQKMFRYLEDSESGKFEAEVCAKLGVKHALFVNSGTSALACCLAGLGIGTGDEVIVQGYTYIATASACIEVGAVPVIAEIDESLGLDPADVEKKITPYTKAVIMTHMQGVPGRIAQIRALTKKYGIYMIEDCCQAIGSTYNGKHTGVESDAFAWSLNYYKNITCGEGGVFFSNNDDVYGRAYYQSDPAGEMWKTGMTGKGAHVQAFTKACYRGNEIAAAVARVQLTKLDDILKKTRKLKKTLLAHLNTPKNYVLQHVDDPEGDCGISFAMIIKDESLCKPFSEALGREGLKVGAAYSADFPDRHVYCYWDALLGDHQGNIQNYPWNNPAYKGKEKYTKDMCPKTIDILARSIRIPIHLALTEQNMIEFADAINKADASI
ncbi:MAG: DegT/DnrJ/EryC1/StrS family aminotransferase [Oscillospiraceae bacterium]|jgi:dTDP-4-amino-4,6-dideoxygalactose transaminase